MRPKGPWGRLSLLFCPPTPSSLCNPTENPGDGGRDPALQQGQVLQREVHEDHLVPQVGWPCPGVPGGREPEPAPELSPKGLAETTPQPPPLVHRGSPRREQLSEAQKGGSPGKVGTLVLGTFSQCLHSHGRTIVLEQHLGTEGGKDSGRKENQVVTWVMVPLWGSAALAHSGSQAEGRQAGRGTWGADG